MLCDNCGAEIEKGSTFCGICGAKVGDGKHKKMSANPADQGNAGAYSMGDDEKTTVLPGNDERTTLLTGDEKTVVIAQNQIEGYVPPVAQMNQPKPQFNAPQNMPGLSLANNQASNSQKNFENEPIMPAYNATVPQSGNTKSNIIIIIVVIIAMIALFVGGFFGISYLVSDNGDTHEMVADSREVMTYDMPELWQ